MLSVELDTLMLERLKRQGMVTVSELVRDLGVTAMTVRRHLLKLEKTGLLQKVHGGAILISDESQHEAAFVNKEQVADYEKNLIAREALTLIKDGDAILLDAGTTVFQLAKLLKEKRDLTVVTSDLHTALELCTSDIRLFFAGGEIEKDLGRARGVRTLEFFSEIHVDISFLGISAISDSFVLGCYSFDNPELKRTMLRCGTKKVLLTDRGKFGRKAFAQVGPLSMIDVLITDKEFDEREMSYLAANNVQLLQTRNVHSSNSPALRRDPLN
jgi:DeoR/GlpR family transcriptional regulator of sugar metabolism